MKDFGKMLEQDHGEHSQKVQGKAQELGVTPPQEPSTTQKSMYDRLSKLSGAQFDQHQFVKAMVTDHKEEIAKYEKEAKSKGPLADIAKDTLPTLQHHLQTAETLAKQKSNLCKGEASRPSGKIRLRGAGSSGRRELVHTNGISGKRNEKPRCTRRGFSVGNHIGSAVLHNRLHTALTRTQPVP